MVTRTRIGRSRALVDTALIFLVVLALSLFVFNFLNQREHDRIRDLDYQACLADRQIATNQRRVLLALIELERSERKHLRLEHDGEALRAALRKIPTFRCVR